MSRYLVNRGNLLIFGTLVGFLVLIGGATWERFAAASLARAWTEHTYEVIRGIADLALAMREAESAERGFLLTGDENALAPHESARARIPALQADLARLTSDNAVQQERLRTLAPLIQAKLEQFAATIELRRAHGFDVAQRAVLADSGRGLMQHVMATLADMNRTEQVLLIDRLQQADQRAMVVRLLVLAGGVVAMLALLWAARLLNHALRRSAQVELEQRTLALRLNTALDSLSQGVAVFGPTHQLRHWNTCFHVLLNLPSILLRAGTPYAAIAAHGAPAPLLEDEAQIRHGWLGSNDPVVYERRLPSGQLLELRRTPMPDGGFVLTITDLTKRAESEAVLREAQKMQAIGQLTGGVAHDFNNLLTVILGNLEFVRTRLEGQPNLHGRVDRAIWAAQRGATLTGQLLAFARRQPLAPAALDLSATLPELVPLLRRTLGEHIDVRYIDAAGLWPAMADAAQLESAVLNLALNARDAMPGGGRLTIELANKVLDAEYARQHAEVTQGDYVMLAVSDTGHGMTPEIAARVFEPFFTTKPEGKGTGLGLAMVFGFVKQSGGHINIYSEPGDGTTVRLYLPRATGAVVGQRSVSPVELPHGNATVLLVEDEAAVREIAAALLVDLGYRVIEAADGTEALRAFGSHGNDIDLLLTDVVLPGPFRGRELAERLRALRPTLRVVYMSGYTENSIVHHGRLDDGVQLISKPFKREELARKVANALGPAQPEGNVVDLRPRKRD